MTNRAMIETAHKIARLAVLAAALPLLGACNLPILGGSAAATYLTSIDGTPPADTSGELAEHKLWCYRTIGYPECYAHAQDVPPNRLIAVDPAREQPIDLPTYREAVLEGR